ncbi:MAG: YtxH domain-containing protein [Acidobacteria bacterium]|nr:YtxH domain-containing protein [Acidobacteriota bacterium]
MSREHDGHASVVFMAFLMGAVTGAAVALLWTPSTGVQNRRLLNEKAREGRERATSAAQRGREFVQRQREQLAAAADRGGGAFEPSVEGSVEPVEEHG